jgi:hypothetical protein
MTFSSVLAIDTVAPDPFPDYDYKQRGLSDGNAHHTVITPREILVLGHPRRRQPARPAGGSLRPVKSPFHGASIHHHELELKNTRTDQVRCTPSHPPSVHGYVLRTTVLYKYYF